MVLNTFPRLSGALVNLRKLSVNYAQAIADRMNSNISKYLYEVPDPYSVQDALSFINTAHNDFDIINIISQAMEITIETKVSDIYSLIILYCNKLIPQFL